MKQSPSGFPYKHKYFGERRCIPPWQDPVIEILPYFLSEHKLIRRAAGTVADNQRIFTNGKLLYNISSPLSVTKTGSPKCPTGYRPQSLIPDSNPYVQYPQVKRESSLKDLPYYQSGTYQRPSGRS